MIFQILYSVPGVVFFSYVWLVPESLRWLVSNGRVDESRRLLIKTARINGVSLSEEVLNKTLKTEEQSNHDGDDDDDSGKTLYTVLDLFRPGFFHSLILSSDIFVVGSLMDSLGGVL